MISAIKKYKVSIFGESYSLVSDDAESQVAGAAQRVDSLMRDIAQQAQVADPKKIAVLTALKLADQVQRLQEQLGQKNKEQERLLDLIDRELSCL